MNMILDALERGPLGRKLKCARGMIGPYPIDTMLDMLVDLVANGTLHSFNADDAWESGDGHITFN
jgi:hypothetical protein